MNYKSFIQSKTEFCHSHGFDVGTLGYPLFPHQAALTKWALRKGHALIAADTGLGKTRMELVWGIHVHQQMKRRFIGVELKKSYYDQACANIRNSLLQGDLFG